MFNPFADILNGFNVDTDVYHAMFEEPAPHTLTMPICFMTEPGADKSGARAAIDLVRNDLEKFARGAAHGPLVRLITQVPDTFEYGIGELQAVTWSIMPESAKEWAVDGLFVEAGYYNHGTAFARKPAQEILNAMMLYDVAVAESDSVEPVDHKALLVGERFAREWTAAVDDLYLAKIGVWCRELLDHRTMILIICRALMMGRDPVAEYNRFIKAGGKYFLEYPRLCP